MSRRSSSAEEEYDEEEDDAFDRAHRQLYAARGAAAPLEASDEEVGASGVEFAVAPPVVQFDVNNRRDELTAALERAETEVLVLAVEMRRLEALVAASWRRRREQEIQWRARRGAWT